MGGANAVVVAISDVIRRLRMEDMVDEKMVASLSLFYVVGLSVYCGATGDGGGAMMTHQRICEETEITFVKK